MYSISVLLKQTAHTRIQNQCSIHLTRISKQDFLLIQKIISTMSKIKMKNIFSLK